MENKHIQNSRNENNKKNDTTKKIGKIYIQENEYIKNHVNWFLKNHSDTIEDFYQEVSKQYPVKKEIKTGTRVLV